MGHERPGLLAMRLFAVTEPKHVFAVMKRVFGFMSFFLPEGRVANATLCCYITICTVCFTHETYKRIQKLGVEPDAFLSGCMLDLYARTDMVTEAQEVFKVLKEKQHANEFSFSMMLSLYKKNGRLNEATEIAKKMLESGFLTNVLSFNSVISLFIADGRLREAAEVFHQMLKLKASPNENTYKTLGILLKRGGFPLSVDAMNY